MKKDTAFLNAFRGFAALWVVIGHCSIWGGYQLVPLPNPKQAVDLFMVLSGFLMVYTIDARPDERGDLRTWLAFYIRRLFRIVPAYYVALILVALLWDQYAHGFEAFRTLNPAAWAGDTTYDPSRYSIDPPNLLWHASFLFGLNPALVDATMLPDWSLSLEMQFYAAFPVLYLLLRRRPGVAMMFAVGVGALILESAYGHATQALGWPAFPEPSVLIFKLPIFLAGMMIYEAGRDAFRPAALFFGFWLLLASYRSAGPEGLVFLSLTGGLALMWLVPGTGAIGRVVRHPAVTFASDTSYSVYLFHEFFLSLIGSRILVALLAIGWPKGLAVAAMAVSVSVSVYPFSYLVYRIVERPGIKWGAALAGSWLRRRAPQPAA